MKNCIASLMLTVVFLGTAAVQSAVIRVPADQPNIQFAINAAQNGDTVLVADGAYTGADNRNLNFFGKAITVRSENGPANCIIDCQALGRGFYFNNGESSSSVVDGFTIKNGYVSGGGTSGYGGGIYVNGASPTITNCTIQACFSDHYGGGVYVFGAGVFSNCKFISNLANSRGGGAYCAGALTTFINCEFIMNIAYNTGSMGRAGGGIYAASPVFVSDCSFISNQAEEGAGIYTSDITIHNSAFLDNQCLGPSGNQRGGGIYMNLGSAGTLLQNCTFAYNGSTLGASIYNVSNSGHLVNCIFWDNTAGLYHQGSTQLTAEYSNIRLPGSSVYPGTGNINTNPLFVSDIHLSHIAAGQAQNSPCIDAGKLLASNTCYLGTGGIHGTTVCLNIYTTRTDKVTDSGQVDMGYHYFSVAHTPTATPTMTPTPTNTPTTGPGDPTNTPQPTNTPRPTNTPQPTRTPTPTPGGDCIHHGDVNLDGQITAADAQLAFFIVLGTYSPTYQQECAADCNGDGDITAADAQSIFLVVLGMGECADPL